MCIFIILIFDFIKTFISFQLAKTPIYFSDLGFPIVTRSGKWEWNTEHWKNGHSMLLQTEVNNIPIDIYATPFHDSMNTPVDIEVITNLKLYQQTAEEGVEVMVETHALVMGLNFGWGLTKLQEFIVLLECMFG